VVFYFYIYLDCLLNNTFEVSVVLFGYLCFYSCGNKLYMTQDLFLQLIMDLNPIANASLDVAKEFTDVVVNVSSALADSSHIAAWKTAQRVSNVYDHRTIIFKY